MNLQQLGAVLQGCLSNDQSVRSQAEAMLKQNETIPGQCVNLLRVAAEESIDVSVRQVAAISFKNLVKKAWEVSDASVASGSHQINDEDKSVSRDNLLEILIRAPHIVQVQLGETFKAVVYNDFPRHWPNLLPNLLINLGHHEEGRVHGALVALRILARKYEFRDEDERAPINEVTNQTFPLLLRILQQMLASPATGSSLALYIKLAFKIFWSSCYMEVPSILLTQDQFVGWMQCLISFISKPLAPELQTHVVDPEEAATNPWWKAKKWAMHIAYRLFSRYAVTKYCKEGNDKAFSEMYKKECMASFLDVHLTLAQSSMQGTFLSPRCLNLVFQYLNHAVEVKPMYERVKEHWDAILHNAAFPIMCFSNEDKKLWTDDPHEYVRKGYDILEDMYSPKTSCANLAHSLCTKKKAHLDSFMRMLLGVLTSHQAKLLEPGGASEADARKMDGAMMAVGIMVDLLKQKQPYKQQLATMLITFILPCFKSPYGHIRAKAVWLCGVFSDVDFSQQGGAPGGKGQGQVYEQLFGAVVQCMSDPELPVRVDSVVALRHFIEEVEDLEPIAAIIPNLLSNIFHLMNEVDNEDLVFALEAIVDKFGERIAPYAITMAQQLSIAFWKYANANEEDEDDEEMASMAAYGCMRALNTLLSSVSSLPDLYPPLEEILLPILSKMISSEGQDVFEEVLEMLAFFTFYGPAPVSDRMWTLWPQLHACLLEFGIDYWDNILAPLDNMISRGTERFLTSRDPDYLASAFQMVQHSLKEDDFGERDVVCAPKLLSIILQTCRGRVDHYLQPFLQVVLVKLQGAKNRTLKDTLVLVVSDALHYNAPLTIATLSHQGALAPFFSAWFSMIFRSKKSGKATHFRRMYDKKVCVLGLISILMVPDEALSPELRAGLPQVLSGVIRLLTLLHQQEEETAKMQAEEAEEAEDEEDDEDEDKEDWDWGEDAIELDDEEGGGTSRGARLAARQAAKDAAEAELEEDDDDSDDEWTDDEECETAIDPIDPYIHFIDQLGSLQVLNPVRHSALLASVDALGQVAVQGIATIAEKQRLAKAQQANPAVGGKS